MADVLATNNAVSSLASGLSNAATSLTLGTGEGARFPVPSAGNHFYVTIIDTLGNFEIVKVTARATDILTIVRAQDNTTAKTFSSGSSVELLPVAAIITDIFAAINSKLASASYTAADVLAKLLTVDGAGSGLDADLLDGQSSAYYTDIASRLGYTPLNAAGGTVGSTLVLGSNSVSGSASGILLFGSGTLGAAQLAVYGQSHGTNPGRFRLRSSNGASNYDLVSDLFNGIDLQWRGQNVWYAGNDGAGSGLDADLLDGQDGAFYRSASNLNAGTVPDARLPSYLQAAAVVAGSHTPTATRIANVTGETVYTVSYIRVLGKIFAFGRIDINATGAGNIQLALSLPVTSNLSAVESLAGTINQSGGGYTGTILGDVANDRADVVINVGAGGNNAYSFMYAYNII